MTRSERKVVEPERALLERRANRMDLVARWADDLAHEIKNPLHAMVINLELVKRRAAGGDVLPAVERAEVVEAELHRVHALVESLLRLIRPWPDHTESDVARVFEHLLPVITARSRIRKVSFDHRPGEARVRMPPGDLAQVLLNLIDNAIDAMSEEGSLITGFEAEGDCVRIYVTSTGDLPEAFTPGADPISSLEPRAGRAGLGLAVSDRIVRGAGGALQLRPSDSGSGTTALVQLPGSASA